MTYRFDPASTMINTLYLPELREMLESGDADGLREFCTALHPARTAEFMEGLTAAEAWTVLQAADQPTARRNFRVSRPAEADRDHRNVRSRERCPVIADMPADDRVDLLNAVDEEVSRSVTALVPLEERRDILRLQSYPEGTAGAVMTTDVARCRNRSPSARRSRH